MEENDDEMKVDLRGKLCPYPIAHVIYVVDVMEKGEKKVFLIDDPLAKKSIPEELEDYEDIEIEIEKNSAEKCWEVLIKR
jgi:TusA-related sulfurtransferase